MLSATLIIAVRKHHLQVECFEVKSYILHRGCSSTPLQHCQVQKLWSMCHDVATAHGSLEGKWLTKGLGLKLRHAIESSGSSIWLDGEVALPWASFMLFWWWRGMHVTFAILFNHVTVCKSQFGWLDEFDMKLPTVCPWHSLLFITIALWPKAACKPFECLQQFYMPEAINEPLI